MVILWYIKISANSTTKHETLSIVEKVGKNIVDIQLETLLLHHLHMVMVNIQSIYQDSMVIISMKVIL